MNYYLQLSDYSLMGSVILEWKDVRFVAFSFYFSDYIKKYIVFRSSLEISSLALAIISSFMLIATMLKSIWVS
jgi:hypothetical protein